LPVLGLDEVVLHEGIVGSEVQQFSDDLAEGIVRAWASGKAKDSLVLASDRDEVVDGWIVETLNIGSKELPTLRESDGVETLRELGIVLDLGVSLHDLVVHVHQEPVVLVFDRGVSDFNAHDVNPG